MLPPRAPERAKTHARKPRVYRRAIARLTRVQAQDGPAGALRTLHFLLHEQGALKGRADYVEPTHVPLFEGEVAWFEVERVERGNGHTWPWWRAIRQVEPPDNA